ncbi:MAG: site-2 protease family protein [Candidatus Thermoplasmatota archaeon]|jgi:membrane-associated protease RseP (regulator of RpoE activity)|nr:site-2 protease family protein [Candidatus Thermoplasmatota archaeon]MCL5793999.1 site-2 protease family protein [Candidatus Thermoplasmatota archaeon]
MDPSGITIRSQNENLEYVVNLVKSRIIVYDVQVNPVSLVFFYLDSENPNFEEEFDEIRKELVPKGYVPFVRRNGETTIVVTKLPSQKYATSRVNIILFFLTLASTVYVGSLYSRAFTASVPMSVVYGFIFFSAPLMLILGLHELGHYFTAKKYHVKASFPFFIPFPLTIGTFGAFISLRDPIPSRKAMTEIGAAGPIVGFLTSLPLLFVADYLNSIFHPISTVTSFQLNFPAIYSLLGIHINVSKPVFPMVFAVWVGIFATAMNLLPISQLDGGHVARGILGRRSQVLGYIVVGFLLIAGLYYPGWFFLAFFAFFMGLSHPPALNDYSKLKPVDMVIGVAALLMFALCFTFIPITAP